ncbi:hypothetical protein ACE2AJ_17585 [Aquihabitans daechungensis]|uniref:hypothetical protein n=1 Tax=Aquihabitans daechungensis TaxID=1052257 RepID=UPI003B9DD9CD
MTHDGRAVCPSCGRLASRLATMDPDPVDVAEPRAATPPTAPTAPTPAPPPPKPAAPSPPKPAAAKPVAPKPAPPATPPPPPAPPRSDVPAAPGDRWPTPAPLPPEDEGRAWWKLAVVAAAVVLLVIVGLVFALGGSDDGGGDAAGPEGNGSVDISDLDDPTTTGPPEETTTTEEATTTTVVTADGRVLVESDEGISWSMGGPPEISETSAGRSWVAVNGSDLESVFIYPGEGADLDALLTQQAEAYDGKLSKIQESHIAEADGRTASFTGTTTDDEPIVGYLVGAVVGDQVVIAQTTRIDGELDDLYLDFLDLPASFDLG